MISSIITGIIFGIGSWFVSPEITWRLGYIGLCYSMLFFADWVTDYHG